MLLWFENYFENVFNDIFFDGENYELKARVILEGRYVKSDAYVDDIEKMRDQVRQPIPEFKSRFSLEEIRAMQ